ncbi:hypothetical protein AALP_AA1G291200 [Arabis alpina]|uniref:TF-B3 domain-containing protein n=1 Tax=Arabis alpina TaxID=50452 RepID=A0A087HRE2_ARAAL|nr:hypothetical protein AALP_AA1G291200 [Arabis alpina]
MDNFLPFSSSNANSVQEQHSMDLTNNFSHFPTFHTYDHQHHMLPPYANVACSSEGFPQIPVMQTGCEFGSMVCNPGLRQERGGFSDPHMTKMARINRKNAMIRSRNNSSPNSRANDLVESRRQMMLNMKKNAEIAATKDLYRYSTYDNKKLRVLLVKDLKNSDVGSLGRIVLPKRESEANLPKLTGKEGIIVEMRDADSSSSWSFKYKFWSNNKSRMYVLENTGEFVKKNGVETGDSLTIYEDENKNLYFSITKSEKHTERNENVLMEVNPNYYGGLMFDYLPRDEEEASIEMLIGNLNDHYPITDDLMSITLDLQNHIPAPSSSPLVGHMTNPSHMGPSNDHETFNDFNW